MVLRQMGKRLDSALRIRDSALEKLQVEALFVDTNLGPTLSWRKDRLTMLYRTPFQKLPPVPERLKYMAALLGKQLENLSYRLDIWDTEYGGKVLNIEWNAEGDVQLVSFRRGAWESKVLAFRSFRNS